MSYQDSHGQDFYLLNKFQQSLCVGWKDVADIYNIKKFSKSGYSNQLEGGHTSQEKFKNWFFSGFIE